MLCWLLASSRRCHRAGEGGWQADAKGAGKADAKAAGEADAKGAGEADAKGAGEADAKAAAKAKARAEAQAKNARANILRGEYGPYRANNDLLYYHLDVRVDPEKQTIGGKNTIRFRMLKDDTKIQLDLHPALKVDKILFGEVPLKSERELGTVFVTFPETLKAGAGLFDRLLLFGQACAGGGGSAA